MKFKTKIKRYLQRQILGKLVKKYLDQLFIGFMVFVTLIISFSDPIGVKDADAEEQTIHIIIEQKFPVACITIWGNICISSIHKDDDSNGGNTTINNGNQIANSVLQNGNLLNNHHDEEHNNNTNPWANHKNPYPAIKNPWGDK